MPDPIVIYGTGGMGREALEAALAWPETLDVLGFLTDDASGHGTKVMGFPVLGGREWLAGRMHVRVAVAVGDPRGRARLVSELRARFVSLIHPSATISPSAEIGVGSILLPGAVLSAGARLGEHCIVNLSATVSHDCVLEDFATLSPGVNLAGYVSLGRESALGVGASVLPRVHVGARAIVGAGAVVTRDVPPEAVVAGVPARVLRDRHEGPVF